MSQSIPQSYDDEYAQCSTFWPDHPGKYVIALLRHLSTGRVLDLGAGLGGNALHLIRLGFEVVAVEISDHAVAVLRDKAQTLSPEDRRRLQIVHADAQTYVPDGSFDAAIAYGLLHCLTSETAIRHVTNILQRSTCSGGLNVVVALTNRLPAPASQPYLAHNCLSERMMRELYADWSFCSFEHTLLTERHPTSLDEHQHSICRLLARNIEP